MNAYDIRCDCGHSETIYTLDEREDAICRNCGDLVKVEKKN